MRKVLGLFLFFLSIFGFVFAETIVFKTGRQIQGTVIERTDHYITVDSGTGITLTYYLDEIESIGGQEVVLPEKEAIFEFDYSYQEQEPESHIIPAEASQRELASQEPSAVATVEPQVKQPESVFFEPEAREPALPTQPSRSSRVSDEGSFDISFSLSTGSGESVGAPRPEGFIFVLVWAIITVFFIAAFWKVFSKAGQPGWASLIPIYNNYVMVKIANRPSWWLVLFFIPFVNAIILFIISIDIAKNFGKGTGFGLGLFFLSFIFYPVLAFSSAEYSNALPQGSTFV